MQLRTRDERFTFELRWSFVSVLAERFVIGSLWWYIMSLLLDRPTAYWPMMVLFVSLTTSAVLLHELGHVLGYAITGLRWNRIRLSRVPSVGCDGEANPRQQLIISPLGPGVQIIVGVVLIALSYHVDAWQAFWTAGLAVILEGVAGMFIPLGHNSDASKLYRSIASAKIDRRTRESE